MASTNKTANLKLSQYVNSDRPSYLQDYNEDMLKIDNGFNKLNGNAKETNWLKLPVNEQSYYTAELTSVRIKRIGNVVYCTGFVNNRRKNDATDYNLFNDKYSIFKTSNYIITAEITPEMVNWSSTINSYL